MNTTECLFIEGKRQLNLYDFYKIKFMQQHFKGSVLSF